MMNNIIDERITLETAKILKEKKFEVLIKGFWVEYLKTHKSDNPSFRMKRGKIEFEDIYMKNNDFSDFSNEGYICYSAPTQDLVARWLREVHGLQVYVYSSTKNGEGKYRDYVAYLNGVALNDARDEDFQIYEEAMEYGLKTTLTQIQ